MEMVLVRIRMCLMILHSSRDRCLEVQRNQTILLELVHMEHMIGWLLGRSSSWNMEMVQLLRDMIWLKVHSSREMKLVHSSSCSMKQLMGHKEYNLEFVHCNSSMEHMELVLQHRCRSQCMVHMSRDQRGVLRSNQSRLGQLESIVDMIQSLRYSMSIERMEMARYQRSIIQLKVHSSKEELMELHSNQSIKLEMVRTQQILDLVHSIGSR